MVHTAALKRFSAKAGVGNYPGMAECCPPGRGCNSLRGDEACALTLCRLDKQQPDAARALARWEELQRLDADDRSAERRFRRRAFERARDRALQALAMRLRPWMLTRSRRVAAGQPRVRRATRQRRRIARGRMA